MTFRDPGYLWLLAPLVLVLAGSLFLPPRGRRARLFPAAVRGLLAALLILALSGPRVASTARGRSVAFLVDVSRSVPPSRLAALTDWLVQVRAARGPEDDDEVILFADGAAVEVPFGSGEPGVRSSPDLLRPGSRVDRDATDIAAAVRLAVSSFPRGRARRVVLVTDGNETRGDAVAEARRAAGDGIELACLPVVYDRPREASLLRLDAPSTAPPSSVVSFTPIVRCARGGGTGTLRAFVDGAPLAEREIALAAGKFRGPTFRARLAGPGMHELSVVLEAEGDTLRRNNEVRALVRVLGEGGVLVVEGGDPASSPVADSLTASGIAVVRRAPGEMPVKAVFYQPFDAVVLSDVSALDLTPAQLDALETAVRDLGVGLLVLGGENAYGPGGYEDTALERALPVRMRVKQKQVLLNGALVLILHTSEFADGNFWAVEIARRSIAALGPRDYAGVIIYGPRGDEFAVPLAPVRDLGAVLGRLGSMNPGDMPSFDSSLALAENALRNVPAHLKHIVVISDGDAAQPDPRLIGRLTDARITVSSVCIAAHNRSGERVMAALARWGKGRFYLLTRRQVSTLPRIFVKEATTLRRAAVRRKPFVPRFTTAPEDRPPALRGLAPLPSLDAYSLTEAKPRAEVSIVSPDGDPILAAWRYGLGRATAFTSALRGGWIGAFAGWARLDRFLAQITRDVFRQAGRSGFHATVTVVGDTAIVRVTALSDTGEELDLLHLEGTAAGAGHSPQPFPVVQKGAGIYEGRFRVQGEGTRLAVIRYRDPATGAVQQLEVPVSVPYPAEYAAPATNRAFFERLAAETGARLLSGTEDVYAGPIASSRAPRPLATLLVALAALLLPLDVLVRRLRVSPGAWLARLVPRRRAVPRPGVERAPAGGGGPPTAPDEFRPARPEARPPGEEAEDGGLSGLLEAKKRARRRQDWEETGR